MTTSKPTTPTIPAILPMSGYVRLAVLITIIPLSASTIWRKARNGTFPAPIKLSENATAWEVNSVRAWMASTEAKGG